MRKIAGAGHVLNQFVTEDVGLSRPPTEVTDIWMNDVQNELVAAAQKDGAALGVSDHQLADVLGARIRHFSTGEAVPGLNIGPIWHDDYNSIMTWQAFTANGAAYTGYASVLVGSLLIDTQPTARVGYVKSGVSNLSRTVYAALRGWAMHNGIKVDSGVWAAGTIAVKDNVDGITFTAFDVRGEFPRFLDDGRAIDVGRLFGTYQKASSILTGGINSVADASYTRPSVDVLDGGNDGTQAGNRLLISLPGPTLEAFNYNKISVKPRNTSFLATIKF